MKKIIIFGTGGNALDILDLLQDLNDAHKERRYHCAGFLDDAAHLHGQSIQGVPILGPLSASADYADCLFVNGIGNVKTFARKEQFLSQLNLPPDRFVTLIHPSATVSRSAILAPGSVVLPQVTIAAHVTIGQHVMILPNAVISHHDRIGDYTAIASGACLAGEVTVGRACYLGMRCAIRERLQIGDRALIGMGSVVLQSVENDAVVYGNPARASSRPARSLLS
ncbi:MAG: acetyltransferase [Magnetococcales bacterium]|nr:acetyltransferase [Magnetococcales bacterium]